MDVYVARQPIFNENKDIYGYELLFRGGPENFFTEIDGDIATSTVLSNSFFTIGIEKITGWKTAFINFTRDLLISRVPLLFPREKIVVEILEDVEPEKDVISVCEEFSTRGYHIALDDFFYKSSMDPLIALADIVKLDFKSNSAEETEQYVKKLARHKVALLAEKVETYAEFKQASDMGFKYFQGYFFSKPEVIKARDVTPMELNLFEIMAVANKPDFKFSELEKVVSRDVALSYKLMRYINSTYFKTLNDISSIKQAIVLMGEQRIRRFLSLIAMARLAADKPSELIRTSIVRAKFCERIAEINRSGHSASELFTLGLFSLIDAILDDSMANLMQKLPLSENIKKALIDRQGALNDYLKLAVSYETGDWEGVSRSAAKLRIKETDLPGCFMEALEWADSFTSI